MATRHDSKNSRFWEMDIDLAIFQRLATVINNANGKVLITV